MQHTQPSTRQPDNFTLFDLVRVAVTAAMVVSLTQTAAAVPAKLKRDCRSDYKLLCPHYKVGTAKMRSCMRANGRQLSWDCYQALKDHGYVRQR